MQPAVRIAQAHDKEGVQQTFESERGKAGAETVSQLWELWTLDPDNIPLVVVDSSDRVLAFTNLSIYKAREGWMEDLVVHLEARKAGLATMLINHCLQIVKQLPGRYLGLDVFSDNSVAINLYEKMSFSFLFSYVRMDGVMDQRVKERVARLSEQNRRVVVRPPTVDQSTRAWEFLTSSTGFSHQALEIERSKSGIVTLDHHKSRTFDIEDFRQHIHAGTVLLAYSMTSGEPLGILLYQRDRHWTDHNRVIWGSSALVDKYPDLDDVLVINHLAANNNADVAPSDLARHLVAEAIRRSVQERPMYTRAYPTIEDTDTIKVLQEFGLEVRRWDRPPDSHFRVYARQL